MNSLSLLVLVMAVGLSQAFLPFSMFGANLKRSMVDSERRARAVEEDAKREISQMVDRLAAVVSHAQQEARKREAPSVVGSIFNPGAFRIEVENRKRDAEKTLNDKLDAIVNQIEAAADAAEAEGKKRRNVPSFGESQFRVPFTFIKNHKQRRDAQGVQQQVNDVVDEINAAIGGDDAMDSYNARRSLIKCAPLGTSCHLFKHCCGDYTCNRNGYSWSGTCE